MCDGQVFQRLLFITNRVCSRLWPVSIQHRWWFRFWPCPCCVSDMTCLALCLTHFAKVSSAPAHHSFALRHVPWTTTVGCVPWDIHLFIEALDLFVSHVGDCLNLPLVNSCIPATFHSWPHWSSIVFSSCYGLLIDVFAHCAISGPLCTCHSTLMPLTIQHFGNLKLIGLNFTPFWS